MSPRTLLLLTGSLLAPAACEPAAPPEAPPPAEPASEQPAAVQGEVEPTFVGRWAADPAWCRNDSGAERPIRLTLRRFEGYENVCDVRALMRDDTGWEATLACEAEGARTTERLRLQPVGDHLMITWRDRDDAEVLFTRCPEPDAAQADADLRR